MKATLKQYQQSPQKVRLVADFVRGKNVNRALTELSFVPKKASSVVAKLLKSALANATENDGKDADTLFIKEIRVDDGAIMYLNATTSTRTWNANPKANKSHFSNA